MRGLFISALVIGLILSLPSSASAKMVNKGVSWHPTSLKTQVDLDQTILTTKALGANMVRIDVLWANLEKTAKGEIDLDYLNSIDNLVNNANSQGLKIVLTLWSSPCWASADPNKICPGTGRSSEDFFERYPPVNLTDYADIAKFLVSRYYGKITAFEVWNEPNYDGFWIERDPVKYSELLKATYPQVKSVDPRVKVLTGGLLGHAGSYLKWIYKFGGRGYFDGVSYHPYLFGYGPHEVGEYLKDQSLDIRKIQKKYNDLKPHWITEFGYSTCRNYDCVSRKQQAKFTGEAFNIFKQSPFIKTLLIYEIRDSGTDISSYEDNFGVVDYNYAPKPLFARLKKLFAKS